MSLQFELLVHPMCPFAQRCLYVASLKQLKLDVRHVDLEQKPSWFFEENPEGYLPALIVRTGSSRVLIHESLVISQFLESLPGINLYPKGSCPIQSALKKAIIDIQISTNIEPLRRAIRMVYYNNSPNSRHLASFTRIVKTVNNMVPSGSYFSSQLFNTNELTFIDLMAFPLIERIIAFKDLNLPYYNNLDLTNLSLYYASLSQILAISKYQMPLIRFINLRKRMQLKKYKGLQLPASNYDTEPTI